MSTTCQTQDCLVIAFEGRMDTTRCTQIEAEVRNKVARPARPVVFDLDKVEFVSSSFLRLCIYACHHAGDQGFRIVNVNPAVKRVFKISGLDGMLATA